MGDHCGGWAESEDLASNLLRERQALDHLEREGFIVRAHRILLISDAAEDVWVVGEQGARPHKRRGGRILRRKQEVQQVQRRLALVYLVVVVLRELVLHPQIKEAVGCATLTELCLRLQDAFVQNVNDTLAGLHRIPQRVARDGHGERKEAFIHLPVVLLELRAARGCEVVAEEDALRGCEVQVARKRAQLHAVRPRADPLRDVRADGRLL
mmetsp:Transcript_30712/g.77049  ORF Transcript_30712/g.77049 Transcript_30712/m.77049 type:complete len:211 (-) Transcript_30712:467-1099(-)